MTIDHIIFKVYDWFPSGLWLTFSDMNILTNRLLDFRSIATMLKLLDPYNMIIMQIFHCANNTLCCNIPRRHDEELPFWLIRIHERKGLASCRCPVELDIALQNIAVNQENKHNVWTIVWTATNIMIIVQKHMCSPICTLWACLLSTRRRMLAKLWLNFVRSTLILSKLANKIDATRLPSAWWNPILNTPKQVA